MKIEKCTFDYFMDNKSIFSDEKEERPIICIFYPYDESGLFRIDVQFNKFWAIFSFSKHEFKTINQALKYVRKLKNYFNNPLIYFIKDIK